MSEAARIDDTSSCFATALIAETFPQHQALQPGSAQLGDSLHGPTAPGPFRRSASWDPNWKETFGPLYDASPYWKQFWRNGQGAAKEGFVVHDRLLLKKHGDAYRLCVPCRRAQLGVLRYVHTNYSILNRDYMCTMTAIREDYYWPDIMRVGRRLIESFNRTGAQGPEPGEEPTGPGSDLSDAETECRTPLHDVSKVEETSKGTIPTDWRVNMNVGGSDPRYAFTLRVGVLQHSLAPVALGRVTRSQSIAALDSREVAPTVTGRAFSRGSAPPAVTRELPPSTHNAARRSLGLPPTPQARTDRQPSLVKGAVLEKKTTSSFLPIRF